MISNDDRTAPATDLRDIELKVQAGDIEFKLIRRMKRSVMRRTTSGALGFKAVPRSRPIYLLEGPGQSLAELFSRNLPLTLGVTNETGTEKDGRPQAVPEQPARQR